MKNQQFWGQISVVEHITFCRHHEKNLLFLKFLPSFLLVGPSEAGKMQLNYSWLYIGIFTKSAYYYFSNRYSQPFYDVKQKEMENLQFFRGVNFEFIDSMKNNGTKYLLTFDDSCGDICNIMVFIEIANAGRQRGLSFFYIKHNLFHQSQLEQVVEVQNTHNVLLKNPHEMMQVGTLSAHLGLGSKLVDCHRDATTVPYDYFLIDWWLRTNDRICYCTNIGSVPSIFCNMGRFKHSKFLDDEHKIFLYAPNVPINFPQMQKVFRSDLSKVFYPVSRRMHSNSAQRKQAKSKKTSRGKLSKRSLLVSFKKNNLEAK